MIVKQASLKLVKTTGGSHSTPEKCECGSVHFLKSGLAWYCSGCGHYFASKLEATKSLQDNLKSLNSLHDRLKNMLKELNELVK